MRPQADESVIQTLVTDLDHACSQGKPNFYLSQLSIVLSGVYQGISWCLHTQNIYLGKLTPIPRQHVQV